MDEYIDLKLHIGTFMDFEQDKSLDDVITEF